MAASVMRLCGNAVADPIFGDLTAHFDNDAGKFMSGNNGRNAERMLAMVGVHF